MKHWYGRNAEKISIACILITVTLAVIGIVSSASSLLILAGIICIIGAVAFVTYANKPRMSAQ